MKPIQVNDRYGNTYTIRDLATPKHSPKDSATKATYIIEAVDKDGEQVEVFEKASELMQKKGDNHKRW